MSLARDVDGARPRMSLDEVVAFLEREFPQIHHGGRSYHLGAVGALTARILMDHHERHLRTGGTLSRPSMVARAHLLLKAASRAQIGPVGLAVTTNLSFNFLRRPGTTGLVAEARLLKLGRRLAVGEVLITAAGSDELVCHATGTYSIPP